LFKNTKPKGEWEDIQWWDQTDEHLIVWMRYANLPNFKKLWGKMTDVKKGYYMV
jgi:hypothetical protein